MQFTKGSKFMRKLNGHFLLSCLSKAAS